MKSSSSFLLLFVAISFTSCRQNVEPDVRERELSYLRCVVPENLLDFAHVEVPGIENIAIHGKAADQYLGLHLFNGQAKLNGGIRAEISVDYPFNEDDTVRYAWRLMVPEGFQSDAPKNRWWLIAQWHDQPNRNSGETWDEFPSRSPPVLISIGGQDDRIAIAMAYGLQQDKTHGPLFIEPGKWHNVALEIRWSQKTNGRASLYLDDFSQPVTVIDGPNMHNNFQHYLKVGMYRHPQITTDNWIFIDDLAITQNIAP